MRILVVEDDARLAEPVAAALRGQHHTVDVAATGEAGLDLSEAAIHDIVVLDLMLPGIGGLDVCRTLRRRGSRALVLMMTARDGVRDKVAALDEGADDYLVKPFDLEELLARIRALSRRGLDGYRAVLEVGALLIDQDAGQLFYRGGQIELTRTEFAIVETMLRHPARVFSSDQLYERVRSLDGLGASTAIKTHIVNVRKKLRAAGARSDAVVTIRGFGYRLADPEVLRTL